jgi:MOSC domain-containing protein YiiM
MSDKAVVVQVSVGEAHRFSKQAAFTVRLVAGYGIEGDAHGGATIQHRYLARQSATSPNNRQVHLIQAELFDDLRHAGFDVKPGQLGENITTRGIDLLRLPLGVRLHVGASALVELTGLRTPCGYIDKFRRGLKRAMIVQEQAGVTFGPVYLGWSSKAGMSDLAIPLPLRSRQASQSRCQPSKQRGRNPAFSCI